MTRPMPEPVDPARLVELALAVLEADRFPYLATIDGDQPRVRPVSPVRTDGFTVYAVSLDGGGLAEFPNAVRDNGLADRVADAMGVPSQHFVVPAVVLAKPSTREVVPVGFGAMTMDEMADRVAMVVRVRDNGAGRSSRSAVAALLGRDVPDADTTLDIGPSALRSPDAGGAR